MSEMREFLGYPRSDGRVGVRNLEAIIPSCGCANHAACMLHGGEDAAETLGEPIREGAEH